MGEEDGSDGSARLRPQLPHLKVGIQERTRSVKDLQTRLSFHTVHDQVGEKDDVRVVGNHPALGGWDVTRAPRLVTNVDIYPCWISANPVYVELHAEIQYRYVVVSKTGEVSPREEEATNRSIVASGEEMFVEDDGGLYRQKTNTVEDFDEEDATGVHIKMRTPLVHKMTKDQKLEFIKNLEGEADISAYNTVFVVSYKLPVKVIRLENGDFDVEKRASTDGRNFAFLPMLQDIRDRKRANVVCVGWPGIHANNERERMQIEKLLLEYHCIPVFIPKEDLEMFSSFCANYLWPVFHDIMVFFQTCNPRPFDEQGWAAYRTINSLYSSAVVAKHNEGDLVWLHDYHLMMAPSFISRKIRMANIGFFLHCPFPSSDSFKSLPVREELLSGLLGADLLGFQFFAYARNFFVSIKRIYGLDPTFRAGGFMGVEYNGRMVYTKVAHFVYPFQESIKLSTSETVRAKTLEVKKFFEGKTIFANMDRCDELSALVPKFRAFKRFLREKPQHRGKVVLVQYIFDAWSSGETAFMESLRAEADAILDMNPDGVLTSTPLREGGEDQSVDIFIRFNLPDRTDQVALFKAASVLLDTSAKAGLNLMPFEFITAHQDDPEKDSVSIVSEFSGCSRVLLGSLRINPWNANEVVNACDRALMMEPAERKERFETNLMYASQSSPGEWFQEFLCDLKRARKDEGATIASLGFGTRLRHVYYGQDFRKLSIDEVIFSYQRAKNRVFFFDNEGTLAADRRNMIREYGAPKGDVTDLKSHGTAPNSQVLSCLRALCEDNRNTVVILSGRDKKMLEDWFKDVDGIGLAAERGFYYKLPKETGDHWQCLDPNADYTWKTYAFEIMKQFVKRTQGSRIEHKGSALVWQYRDADQHFGSWQAKELSSNLKDLLFGFEVDVAEGTGYVEVKLRGINKGVAVARVLDKVSTLFGEVDFVLSIGDDRSDEDMFEAVNKLFDPCEVEDKNDNASTWSTTDGECATQSSDSDHRDDSKEGLRKPGGLRANTDGSLLKVIRSSGGGSIAGDLSALAGGGMSMGDISPRHKARRFFTCIVGQKTSAAKFFLNDTEEVSELLASLKASTVRKRMDSSSFTWSSGESGASGLRGVGSMPTIGSLNFGQPKMRLGSK